MVALTGFPLETALFSLPSAIVSRSSGCPLLAKHYQSVSLPSFTTQKLSTYGLTFCNSYSVSPGMLHIQTRASNSDEPMINEDKASSSNMNGGDILAPIEQASLLSSEAEASSSSPQADTPESARSASVIRDTLSPAVEESREQGISQESKAGIFPLSDTSNLQRASSSSKGHLSFLPSRKSSQSSEQGSAQKSNRIQNAFERAAAYRTRKSSGGSGDLVSREPLKQSSISPKSQGMENSQVSDSSMSTRKALSSSGDLNTSKESQFLSVSALNSETPAPEDDMSSFSNRDNTPKQEGSSLQNFQSSKPDEDPTPQDPSKSLQAAALSAFRKAKAYKQQTEEMVSALREGSDDLKEKASNSQEEKFVEVEIITRDGVIKRRASKPGKSYMNVKEFKKSGMDFVGLDFAEKKKKSGLPAGLSAGVTAPPSKGLPEVEIITRDAGESVNQMDRNSDDLYKPKVATWGVFPRPANISKTYGGGRTIKPGEQLETDDEKKAREAKTQQLLADYRRKLGLDMDPVIKANCEKIMKQGDSLMDSGKLREALGCFEDIMGQITFKSELHGLAALQGAVCLDSLNRADEAKLMYEKLISHPNQAVKKRARQLLFSFQAMEKLKFSGTYDWDASAYHKYFDAFSVGYNSYNTMYKRSKSDIVQDSDFVQIWPYVIFLSFPLVLVFILILSKSS